MTLYLLHTFRHHLISGQDTYHQGCVPSFKPMSHGSLPSTHLSQSTPNQPPTVPCTQPFASYGVVLRISPYQYHVNSSLASHRPTAFHYRAYLHHELSSSSSSSTDNLLGYRSNRDHLATTPPQTKKKKTYDRQHRLKAI